MFSLDPAVEKYDALTQVLIDEPIRKQLDLIDKASSPYQLEKFYLEMLKQYQPERLHALYTQRMQRRIRTLYRIDNHLVAVLFVNGTVKCYRPDITEMVESLSTAPLSHQRLSALMMQHCSEKLSIDMYANNMPTFADLVSGELSTAEDRKADLFADEKSIETLKQEWERNYQHWQHEYLCLSLAIVSLEPGSRASSSPHGFGYTPTRKISATR